MVVSSRRRAVSATAVALLTLVALGLRVLRLGWQPLWWDEGYSVYFATEPLARMVELTAHDIHPPLYYGLLHVWTSVLGGPAPVTLRLFSVTLGVLAIPLMAWLSANLFAQRPRTIFAATLLLAFSPIHLFYAQEVRMYGLALVLGITASVLMWKLVARPSTLVLVGYVLTATLGLYTLYYLGFLLLAHAIWGIWTVRHVRSRLWRVVGAFVAIALLYLPWMLYAGPKLLGYVGDKVTSDQDTPLNLARYVYLHALAFTGGHVIASETMMQTALHWMTLAGLGALVLLAVGAILQIRRGGNGQTDRSDTVESPSPVEGTPGQSDIAEPASSRIGGMEANGRRHSSSQDEALPAALSPYAALWTFTLVPLFFGFMLNLRLPFFPEGGERLLLFALPYVLLLIASAIDEEWRFYHLGKVAALLLSVSCLAGIVTFYTTPRYVDHDYRPLIGQVVQQGAAEDTFFAVFPWQLGYWRAYVNNEEAESAARPSPLLVGDNAVEWGPQVSDALDGALSKGTVWFPAPLSFGSTLPGEIEGYLSEQATNVENRWVSPATRLSAWRILDEPPFAPVAADFGAVKLTQAGVLPVEAPSANSPIAIRLAWEIGDQAESALSAEDLNVTLRLLDSNGRVWASRDYAPLGSLAVDSPEFATGRSIEETAGMIVPVGLPPDRYEVAAGVSVSGTETLLYPAYSLNETDPLVAIGEIVVTQPETAQPIERLPIQHALTPPEVHDGLAFLGFAGVDADQSHLAGTDIELTLFLQNQSLAPPARQIYVSILEDGQGVGGWEGWTLPTYPTETWPEDALVQTPVSLHVPAVLTDGDYALIAGLLDPLTGEKSPPVSLGDLTVKQRSAVFSQPERQFAVEPPVQFGTHAQLIGYDLDLDSADGKLYLTLHWQVNQTLLPAHHIFVHLDNEFGETVAQDDGSPVTASGRAPTGSWLPSEFVSTLHTVTVPPDITINDLRLRVGIYNPDGNVRLPTSVDGQPTGDDTGLPIPPQ